MFCVEDSFAGTVGEVIKVTKSKYHINELILVKSCEILWVRLIFHSSPCRNFQLINLHMQVIMSLVAFKLEYCLFLRWELLIRTTRGRQCCLRRYIF